MYPLSQAKIPRIVYFLFHVRKLQGYRKLEFENVDVDDVINRQEEFHD